MKKQLIVTLLLLINVFRSADIIAEDKVTKNTSVESSKRNRQQNEKVHKAEIPEDDESVSLQAAALTEEYSRLAQSLSSQDEEVKDMFVYRCKHIRGLTLKKIMDNFVSSSGSVAESAEADIVIVTDVKSNIPMLKQIAENVDQRVPQVMVEARVIELSIDDSFEKELSQVFNHLPAENDALVKEIRTVLGAPGANVDTTQGGLFTIRPYSDTDKEGTVGNRLETFIRVLENRGKAKILSAPNLILQRGREGSIITGEERPILTQTVVSGSISTSTVFKSVGIKLKVKPIMISGSNVRLSISPEVSTVSGFAQAGEGFSNPIIAVRNAATELEVKDGQVISIGGLMRHEERDRVRRVPLLSSLPAVGQFFKSTYSENVKSQLVIFLTIKILKEAKPGDVTIHSTESATRKIADVIDQMEKRMKHPKATIKSDVRLLREKGAQ
ncbi:MAG: type II secretion system protein GspD [Planctomycetota bacterium]|jgi:type II secretory pathway component GspD/PulD (secretin)